MITYPTMPLAGSALTGEARTPRGRYSHVDELGKRGLMEWATVDPGSVNFTRFDTDESGVPSFIYLNPEERVREGMRVCVEHGIRPSFAIYEPGFAQLGAALAKKYPGVKHPVYRWMFSNEFAWGFLRHPTGLRSTWLSCFHLDRTNAELLAELVDMLDRAGHSPASPASIRQHLDKIDKDLSRDIKLSREHSRRQLSHPPEASTDGVYSAASVDMGLVASVTLVSLFQAKCLSCLIMGNNPRVNFA